MRDVIPIIWEPYYGGSSVSAFIAGDRLIWARGIDTRQMQIAASIRERFGEVRLVERTFAWLVREPTNPHDPNSVGVWIGRHHGGYVPREHAAYLAPFIDAIVLPLRPPLTRTHASCLVTIGSQPRDRLWTVGLVGPWADAPPEIRNAPVATSDAEQERTETARGALRAAKETETDAFEKAVAKVQRGLSRSELMQILGPPVRSEEKVTKKVTKHTLFFREDPERRGRFQLRVQIEDDVVVGWIR